MIQIFKNWVEGNFALVMITSLICAFTLPGLEQLPKEAGIILIAMIIFFSCSKVTLAELKSINPQNTILFIALRFIAFPVALYYIALYIVPDLAIGVFLFALMPAGVSSVALANLCGGNASLALTINVISSALTPFIVPLMFLVIVGQNTDIDKFSLLTTLSLSVFMPALLYFGVARKIKPLKTWTQKNCQFFSIFLLAVMLAVVVAPHREAFMDMLIQPTTFTLMLATASIVTGIMYAITWLAPAKMHRKNRITYTICSGANNTGLAIAIAALHFTPTTILFTVMAEIPWIVAVILLERCLREKKTAP